MNRNEIQQHVFHAIQKLAGEETIIKPSAKLDDDLELDRIDVYLILEEISKFNKITASEEECERLSKKSVNYLIEWICQH